MCDVVETIDQALGRVSRELDSAIFDNDYEAIPKLEAELSSLRRLQQAGHTWTVNF